MRASVTAVEDALAAPGAKAVRAVLREVVHFCSEASLLSAVRKVLHLSVRPVGMVDYTGRLGAAGSGGEKQTYLGQGNGGNDNGDGEGLEHDD